MKNNIFTWLGVCTSLTVGVATAQTQPSLEGADCAHLKSAYSRMAETEADNSGIDVKWYYLDLNTSNTSLAIDGSVTILAETTTSINELEFALHDDYTVSEVYVNGREAIFSHENDVIEVLLAPTEEPGTLIECRISYSGTLSDPYARGINQGYVEEWDQSVTYTLSEPLSAYHWFPVKQVLTDKADSVRTHITTPAGIEAASSGMREAMVTLEDGRVRHEWNTRYPMAYYLISMVVGDYQEHNFTIEPEGHDTIWVQNFIWDSPGAMDAYASDAEQTDPIMKFFIDAFGPYPFAGEKYGHVMSSFGGGMENQTMSMMGHYGFTLIAHELGHQWFGDYVTCETWQDIWINEGFARYSEYLAIEALYDRETAEGWRESEVTSILRENNGSVFVPASQATLDRRIFSFRLTYQKGGQLVHMLRHEINDDELFFDILKAFAEAHAFSTATGDDFVAILNEMTGDDYTWFFEQWYYGIGNPEYEIIWQSDTDTLWFQVDQYGSIGTAPFFQGTLPFVLTYDDGSTEEVRVFHSENEQKIGVPISKTVTAVDFDPENAILKEVLSVRRGGVVGFAMEYRPSARLYPQPASQSFVYLEGVGSIKQAYIVDLQGRTFQPTLVEEGSRWRVDVNRLQPGMYQLRLEDELGGLTMPLVIQ